MTLRLLLLVAWMHAQAVAPRAAVSTRLLDADLFVRATATVELRDAVATDPSVLAEQGVQTALVSLLERENARIADNLAAAAKTGKSNLEEDYGEYYSIVFGLANTLRKQGAAPALAARLKRAVIFGTYNPDSPFVEDLAREGDSLVPFVVELSKQSSGPKRWNAYGLAGALFTHAETNRLSNPLTAASAETLRTIARDGLLDPAPDVRIWAIFAVSKARDTQAIPLLERLATSDPDARASKYSVRSVAADALKSIRAGRQP
jgi:hypothetical protein